MADLQDWKVYRYHGSAVTSTNIPLLVLLFGTEGPTAYYTAIDEWGSRPRGAHRRRKTTVKRFMAVYQPYRPCRMDLDCLAQCTTVVHHEEFGDIDSCPQHAADHHEWRRRCEGVHVANWPREPEVDCWCTDAHQANGVYVEYCPAHGTPARRGTSIRPDWLILTEAASQPAPSGELAPRYDLDATGEATNE